MLRVRWLLLVAMTIGLLLGGAPVRAVFDEESDLWGYTETFIVPNTVYGNYLSRADIEAYLGTINDAAAGLDCPPFDLNFVYYSFEEEHEVVSGDTSWSWRKGGIELDWMRLDKEFVLGVSLHVFRYGNALISRVCGNFTSPTAVPPPSITGRKWNDVNGNGVWEAGEPALAGWRITLSGSGQTRSTLTDQHGQYRFVIDANEGLKPATYAISEEQQGGWVNTRSPQAVRVEAGAAGVDYGQNDFGNFQLGRIRGVKWQDVNENGVRDAEDGPLSGWTIQLWKGGGLVASTTTGSDGKYEFAGLLAGSYAVREVTQEGWVVTWPGSGHYNIAVVSGTVAQDVSFGNFKLGRIGAVKFDDTNVNGVNDEGKLLAGWDIVLYKDGAPFATKTTDSRGEVCFDGLHYGSYSLYERTQSDWRQTCPFPGSADVVAAGDRGLGSVGPLLMTSGSEYLNNEFGNVQLGSITKLVRHYWWKEPVPGVAVHIEEVDIPGILDNVPSLPWYGVTGENGKFLFEGLLPGTYKLTIDLPDEWLQETAETVDTEILCENEDSQIVNEIYDNPRREPRTIGFWQNWPHWYSEAEMEAIIVRVKTGSQDFADLSLATLDEMISPRGRRKVTVPEMMRIQYLGFWLNLASERLGFTSEVDISGIAGWNTVVDDCCGESDGVGTIHCLMLELRDQFNSASMSTSQMEVFKNICDAVNNYQVFVEPPTGPID